MRFTRRRPLATVSGWLQGRSRVSLLQQPAEPRDRVAADRRGRPALPRGARRRAGHARRDRPLQGRQHGDHGGCHGRRARELWSYDLLVGSAGPEHAGRAARQRASPMRCGGSGLDEASICSSSATHGRSTFAARAAAVALRRRRPHLRGCPRGLQCAGASSSAPGGNLLFHDAVDTGGVRESTTLIVTRLVGRDRARRRWTSSGSPAPARLRTSCAALDHRRPQLERRRRYGRGKRVAARDQRRSCVDNGSTDGLRRRRSSATSPAIELIRTGANLGFAGGNNVGIRRAFERGADWVLLMNNDAVAGEGLAPGARASGRGQARRGRALACKLLQRRRRDAPCTRASLFNALLPRLFSGRVQGFGTRDDGRFDRAARHRSRRRRRDGRCRARRTRARGAARRGACSLYVEDVDLVAANHGRWGSRSSSSRTRRYALPRHWARPAARFRRRTSTTRRATRSIGLSSAIGRCPFGQLWLRRGVVVTTHPAQAATHPARVAAARAVIEGWRDARAGRLGQRSSR